MELTAGESGEEEEGGFLRAVSAILVGSLLHFPREDEGFLICAMELPFLTENESSNPLSVGSSWGVTHFL